MSDLPDEWSTAGILEVAELLRGVTYGKNDASGAPFEDSIPVLRANNIQDRAFDLENLVHVPKTLVSAAQRIRKGDVVIATSSGSVKLVGKAVQASKDMDSGFGAFCGLLRPKPDIEPRYFGHFFSTDEYRKNVSSMARGVNINNLKREHFASVSIPIAPIAEQKRIADKLDVLLKRVDACRDQLDRVPMLLKRFRQSVLADAMSGALTDDWRRGNSASEWIEVTLKKICISITDGDHQAPPQSEEGIPFITISAINDGKLRFEKSTRWVKKSYYDSLKSERRPQRGDILFSVTGSIGIPASVDTDEPFCFQRHIAILRPDLSRVSSRFLLLALASDQVGDQCKGIATGTAQLTIPLNGLRAVSISLPSTIEQAEIVRRVGKLFAVIDRIDARLAVARKQAERLTPALLAKAFRGELVPQDPNDEPAQALLDRVKAQQENSAPVKVTRGRKRVTS